MARAELGQLPAIESPRIVRAAYGLTGSFGRGWGECTPFSSPKSSS
jgi:hypothetical protein